MKMHPGLLALARGELVALKGDELWCVLEEVKRHRVIHLLREALEGGRLLLTIDEAAMVRAWLAAHELWTSAYVRKYVETAQATVRILAAAGCEVLVVKGWWSMVALHQRPTDRFASDVDLVVSPAWRSRIGDISAVLGESVAAARGGPVGARLYENWLFRRSDTDIDLHRNVLTFEASRGRFAETIWEEYTQMGGAVWAGGRVPSPELGLAQLAVNYCRDRYQWLYQMDDVARAARQVDLDWSRFDELVRLAGVERIVAASLAAVAEVFSIDLPAGAARRSKLMTPWTGCGVVLGAATPSVKDMSRSQILSLLASDSVFHAARGLWSMYVPRSEELVYQLKVRGIAERSSYWSGYLALTFFRIRRYADERRSRGGRVGGSSQRRQPVAGGDDGLAVGSLPLYIVVEASTRTCRQMVGAVGWSVVVRCLLKATSLRTTLAVLDRIPVRRASGVVAIPTERTFARAGACLGRQIARSQYLRRRGARSTLVIGVRPPEETAEIDAHAWLDRLDEPPPYAVLHRIER